MQNFTLKQLRYVEAAGRLGSIARAAAEMSISQSSIAAAIEVLETGLGFNLFIRTPSKGIRPTPQGVQSLALIRRFLQQARNFQTEIQSVAGTARGTIRIACYATAAPSFLPIILRSVTERFPELSITVLEGSLKMIVDFVNEGEADLAFTYDHFRDAKHRFYPLFSAPPYAIVPSDDSIASAGRTTLAELSEKPLVMLDLPGARDYFADMFQKAGYNPVVVHSTRSSEILRALVAGGFGVSLLNIRPLDYREAESGYRIVPISDNVQAAPFGIAINDTAGIPGMIMAFIDNCLELREKGAFSHLVVE
ncbi:LysR family transcriptional regulator [Sedimentitalea nanhaiensis]|uniref:Transcriptional regulator, LysR family n=1 Tax=Sedimentitalea nanhaiensis TaxID=999627 RepID=A0A1I7BWC8_9RHOB|nr:LysR family transcriptional regulator [Sedimentitalea nanhaiensis]SFT91421.1 transcriptional regulator, LysR family [Sedimentitalea nanhaiensis]